MKGRDAPATLLLGGSGSLAQMERGCYADAADLGGGAGGGRDRGWKMEVLRVKRPAF